jgi:hypothetical protein
VTEHLLCKLCLKVCHVNKASAPLTLVARSLPTDAAAACASVVFRLSPSGSRPPLSSPLPQSLPIPRAQPGLLPPPGAERPDPRGVVNPCGRVGVGTRRRLRPPETAATTVGDGTSRGSSSFDPPGAKHDLRSSFPKSSSPRLGLPQIPTCYPLRTRPGLCFAAAATLTHLR